jgi:phenylpropionate dioxygenase-like ring-hydroxylating dioxygenase large terminal subunit
MNRETELSLIDRGLAHLHERTTDLEPEPYRTRAARYLDPARFDRELELVFRAAPVLVAHTLQVPEPGDFETLSLGPRPIVLMRSERGVEAFLNVCRHRGTRIFDVERGRAGPRFSCPYHGWTYDRCGALVGMPHAYGFEGATADRDLASLRASIEGGFVSIGGGEREPSLLRELAALASPTPALYVPERRVLRANWKLAIDIFLEAYHVTIAHRKTIASRFTDNVSVIDRFGDDQRLLFVKKSFAELAGVAREDRVLRPHANVLYHFFPNTFALAQPDHVSLIHVFPIAPDACELSTYTLLPEAPHTERARDYWAKNDRILKDAIAEDFAMAESIQRGLASGANETFLFGRFEHALAHFHRAVDAIADNS